MDRAQCAKTRGNFLKIARFNGTRSPIRAVRMYLVVDTLCCSGKEGERKRVKKIAGIFMAPFFGIIIPAVCDRVRYICMKSRRRRRRGVWGIRRRDCFSTLPEKKLPRHFVNTLIDITEKNNCFFVPTAWAWIRKRRGERNFIVVPKRTSEKQRFPRRMAADRRSTCSLVPETLFV